MSSEPSKTITLSDGSVWVHHPAAEWEGSPMNEWWSCEEQDRGTEEPSLMHDKLLTASDHRKIADVLDPPKELTTPIREQIEALDRWQDADGSGCSDPECCGGPGHAMERDHSGDYLNRAEVLRLFEGER